ncbi:uncharacterized protein VTP21DRAFT_3664 [Calcarisporiella thermophila]|uniref:uncharacterized protein n=1 Tax=Calcarisporiella thermophila TaxID=911321 RepID=UPI0037430671
MQMKLSFVAFVTLIASVLAHPTGKGGITNSCNANQKVACCNQQNSNDADGNGLLGAAVGVFTGCSLIDNLPLAAIIGVSAAVNQKCQNKQAHVCCDTFDQEGLANVGAAQCFSANAL